MSLEQGANVLYLNTGIQLDIILIAYQEGAEKLCRTAWVELSDGRCSDGMQSTNPGKLCQTDDDCPTSRTGQLASCRCGFNNNGSKYCEPEGGDPPWQLARQAVFLHYSSISMNFSL